MSLMTPMPPPAPAPPPDDDPRAGYIAGLRALAGVLETNPGIPLPGSGSRYSLLITFFDEATAKETMAAAARAFPCSWRKKSSGRDGEYFDLTGRLEGLQLELSAPRDVVCERVVTGTEVREVDEVVQPEVTRKVTREVEVVEWRCGTLLG